MLIVLSLLLVAVGVYMAIWGGVLRFRKVQTLVFGKILPIVIGAFVVFMGLKLLLGF